MDLCYGQFVLFQDYIVTIYYGLRTMSRTCVRAGVMASSKVRLYLLNETWLDVDNLYYNALVSQSWLAIVRPSQFIVTVLR